MIFDRVLLLCMNVNPGGIIGAAILSYFPDTILYVSILYILICLQGYVVLLVSQSRAFRILLSAFRILPIPTQTNKNKINGILTGI